MPRHRYMRHWASYAPAVRHWRSRTSVAVGAVVACLVIVVGLSLRHWWPAEVAPDLTPEMVTEINDIDRTVTVIDGGSRDDAHTLWARYHDRATNGDPSEKPRLLGISRARVDSSSVPGSGTYWIVYSGRVWNQSFGPDGSGSGFGHEVVFVDPGSLEVLSSTLT